MPAPDRPRGYGFGPMFGGPPSGQHLRVSDAERRAAADRLADYFAEGRLDQAEFDERVSRAMSAKTRADLSDLFTDLPETAAPATAAPAPGPGGAPAGPVPSRPGRVRSAVVLVVMILIVLSAAHALLAIVPWLWLGFFAVILLFATRTVGHHRPGADR